jgi:GDP-L-fucose synthase
MEKRILITGGSGLVGKSLEKKLLNQECLFLSSKTCNLLNFNQVYNTFYSYKPTHVIHLASRVGGLYDNLESNYEFLSDNLQMHLNVVKMCELFNVKVLINIQSTCVFPNKIKEYPIKSEQLHEGEPHYSNAGYAYSKRMLEKLSFFLYQKSDITVYNLIPTNLYGENDNYNIIKGHVIPSLIHKTWNAINNNTDLVINGDGSASRQFLYVSDFADIIVFFVNKDISTKTYKSIIIAPPENHEIKIKELVEKITSKLGFKNKIIYDSTYSNGQVKKTVSDIELKENGIDYDFTDLDSGLHKTIMFFIKNYNIIRK